MIPLALRILLALAAGLSLILLAALVIGCWAGRRQVQDVSRFYDCPPAQDAWIDPRDIIGIAQHGDRLIFRLSPESVEDA